MTDDPIDESWYEMEKPEPTTENTMTAYFVACTIGVILGCVLYALFRT